MNLQHITEDAIATTLGIGGFLALSFIAIKLLGKFGVPSYTNLSKQDIQATYNELDKNCKLLSRVCGTEGNCNFCRGIYTGCGPMLYYKYSECTGGNINLNLYHIPFEMWTTENNWNPFAAPTHMTYPINQSEY